MCERRTDTAAIVVSHYALVWFSQSQRLESVFGWACRHCRKGWASGLADDQAIEGSDIEDMILGVLVVRIKQSGTYQSS